MSLSGWLFDPRFRQIEHPDMADVVVARFPVRVGQRGDHILHPRLPVIAHRSA